MAIGYQVRLNALTSPPSYTCFVVPGLTQGYDEIAAAINLRNPTIPVETAKTVLLALPEEIKRELANGNTVNLTGFCSFVTTMPVRLASATDPLPTGAVDVQAKPSTPFKNKIKAAATFTRLPATVKAPTITAALDAPTKIDGFIREQYGFQITGSNLGFDPTDATQGVFLLSPAGNFIQQTNLALNEPSKLIIVPTFDTVAGPAGTASVENVLEVRSKYTESGQLRTGSYGKKLRALNVISDATSDKLFVCGSATAGPAIVKTYTGAQVMCRFVAQVKPSGELTLQAGEVGMNLGQEVIVAANGDYVLPGLDANVTVTVSDYTTLMANAMSYARYLVEVCDLNPLT